MPNKNRNITIDQTNEIVYNNLQFSRKESKQENKFFVFVVFSTFFARLPNAAFLRGSHGLRYIAFIFFFLSSFAHYFHHPHSHRPRHPLKSVETKKDNSVLLSFFTLAALLQMELETFNKSSFIINIRGQLQRTSRVGGGFVNTLRSFLPTFIKRCLKQ